MKKSTDKKGHKENMTPQQKKKLKRHHKKKKH